MIRTRLSGLVLAAAIPTASAQIHPATDAPRPHPPEESLRMFHLKPGFRIDLVAAEPLVADPVDIAFDPRGRIFVAELHGYNIDGHFDVQELNKTGRLDMQVRRIQATAEARRKAAPHMFGTVKLLIDTDRDGRMDTAQVWADRLPPCYGVAPARGGVVALCPPEIVFLADPDGDGEAEVKETLFTGLNEGELWSRANNLRQGEDNWIHAVGGRGSRRTVTGPALGSPVELGVTNFRFKADGTAIEPVTGSAGGFGQARTDWGDSFTIANSTVGLHVTPLPYRYLIRNPYIGAPPDHNPLAQYREVFPTSQPHPWRTRRGTEGDWVRFYGRGEATPNGSFTAASSPFVYRAEAFPAEYRGSYFCCESQQNLVHHAELLAEGTAMRVRRTRDEQDREFLTSDEGWFRPVNLRLGPDGGLYIVDMCREIIEDYSAIPRYLQQQYGLDQGLDRGRIWRVTHEAAPRVSKPSLVTASTPALIDQLENANAWWRLTAQRLLVERNDRASILPLKTLAASSEAPQGRFHALQTLEGLEAVDEVLVQTALQDVHPEIRRLALRLSEPFLDRSQGLLARVVSKVEESDARVRLQLAMTLGETPDPLAIEALGRLGAAHGAERWMAAAIASSAAETADQVLDTLLASPGPEANRLAVLGPLTATVGARRSDTQIANVLGTLAGLPEAEGSGVRQECLDGLIRGLRRGPTGRLESTRGQEALTHLLENTSGDAYRAAIELIGLLHLNDSPTLRRVFSHASERALDALLPLEQRVAAVELLRHAPFDQIEPTAGRLLAATQPPTLQIQTVKAIAEARDPEVPAVLLARWPEYAPAMREEVLRALFAQADRIPAVFEAIRSGQLKPGSLSPFQRIQLSERADPEHRASIRKLLNDSPGHVEREKILQRYREALTTGRRNPDHGREVFDQACGACHRIDGRGGDVGPDLGSARGRADETLLSDILEPNSRITLGYRTYLVETFDGTLATGRLTSETATSVVLRQPHSPDQVVLRKDIKSMTATEQSLMPENLDATLSPGDIADVIAFLRRRFGHEVAPALTLFDDEQEFVDLLTSGTGTATLDTSAFKGTHALAVTPPQRYAARLPNWNHPIVEHPKPGEYRFLRLAWRTSTEAAGVLVELAADGRWPDSREATRRYYSGRNTTRWQAKQISTVPPMEWTLVTVDLWSDCGNFILTGLAPTAMGGTVFFDSIELLPSLDAIEYPN